MPFSNAQVKQKGNAAIVFLVITGVIVAGVFYFLSLPKSKSSLFISPKTMQQAEKKYSNSSLGFEFNYSNDLNAKEDSETDFNKRGNGDFRKNFKGYVTYEPGKVLGVVVVLDKNASYETNPLTIWVFDNPDNLDIDGWYQNYWYFPFVWGDFTQKGKIELAPKQEATVSGLAAKSGVIDYQPGKPKFVYISKDKKMYLFRVIGGEGDKILSKLKLLEEKGSDRISIPKPVGSPGTESYCHSLTYKDCANSCEVSPSCPTCQDIGCHAKGAHKLEETNN